MPSVELLLVIVGLPRGTFYYQLVVQSAEDKYADLKRHIHDIYQKQLKDNGLGSEYVPQGKLLGQCGNGKFLRNVEIGMFPYVQI
ncbi:hypothetical protein ACFX50_02720 [Neisseria meningitidis]